MKKSVICILLVILMGVTGCSGLKNQTQETSAKAKKVLITDMAGRQVEVAPTINKVLSASPVGTIIMYSINPKKIAGQNWAPTEAEKEYLVKDYLNLPMLSGWYADGKVGNVEEIVKAAPDFILLTFSGKATQANLDQASMIQEKLKIPVVMIDSKIQNTTKMYEFLGKLLGEEERAQKLSQYAATILNDISSKAKTIDDSKRVTVYYAEGTEGLQTDPSGSEHAQVIDLIGAVNVAKVEIKTGMGRSNVSTEQLLQWSPDVIIACHDQGFAAESATYSAVIKDTRFATLKAIKNNKVYEIPYKPFNYTDRPPSINRLIGLKWLGNLLYPDVYNYDLEKDTKELYKLFYNIDLTQEQVKDIYKFSK